MAELFGAIKLFLKLWPMLKQAAKFGDAWVEDFHVDQKKEKVTIVFSKQKDQNEDTTNDETASNASDFNDIFRK